MGHSYILWAPHGAIRFIHLTSFYVQQYFANTSEQLKQTLSFLVLPFSYILSHFTTVVLEQLTSKQYDRQINGRQIRQSIVTFGVNPLLKTK
jgi:type III secretory pathway component EscU